jgi:phosphoenolpyruvate carboxylase
MTSINYLESGFDKIHRDLQFLIACFSEVLTELGQPELAQSLPWLHEETAPGAAFPERLGQAYALSFQLLNMIEENAAAMTRRARERNDGLESEQGLWGYVLHRLQEKGVSAEQIAQVLQTERVEPVLTVHPTEAKRAAVLEQHRALYLLLFQRENPIWTDAEKEENRQQIKAAIERIWRTGEILISKPDISDERRNLIYYLRDVFPVVLPRLDARLRHAWANAGFDLKYFDGPQTMPGLHFGTWVGGDRDGHPLVTAQTTRETLEELRQNALTVLHRQLSQLWERLPLSSMMQPPPAELQQGIARLSGELGSAAEIILHANAEEPWRQYVALLMAKLPLNNPFTGQPDAALHEPDESPLPNRYRISRELEEDLEVLDRSLHAVGAGRLSRSDLLPVRRAVEVFGFHLASLDIRQNSKFHDTALSQLLQATRVQWNELDVADFGSWPEAERLAFLNAELESPRPFLYAGTPVGPEADAVLDCYRVLVRHIQRYGPRGLGALIISMTRQLSDLLVVYLLAREAGLAKNGSGGLECLLPVVPLFETEDDLRGSAEILRPFLAHPVTQRSLQRHAKSTSSGGLPPAVPSTPVQQVMIGYSDSNKDSGILASQWALQRAQREMTAVGEEFGIDIRFFHGRGGTISRGAGPTHRFLEALPSGSLSGNLRLTEQGETIAQKYANPNTATYNLELLQAGVTGVSLRHKYFRTQPHDLEPIAEQLAVWSRDAYHQLLRMDGFMTFYEGATPIDALEQARIGSRPARRSGRRELSDLRAIPWVFSWNQSRFYLPGWYGIGTALKRLCNENPHGWNHLKEEINTWPFLRYVLTNVETNIASADLQLMGQYAALVEDAGLQHRFFGEIAAEYSRSREMLASLFGHPFEVRRPRMHQTLQLRASALRILHHQQIELLKSWRQLRAGGNDEAASAMLPDLLLSINAIASGLRTTG